MSQRSSTEAGFDALIDGMKVAHDDAIALRGAITGRRSRSDQAGQINKSLERWFKGIGFFDANVAKPPTPTLQLPELTAVESVIDAIAGGGLLGDGVDKSIKRVKGKTGSIQTALGSATVGPTVNLLKQVVDELKKQTRMSKDMKRAAETPDYGYETGNAFT